MILFLFFIFYFNHFQVFCTVILSFRMPASLLSFLLVIRIIDFYICKSLDFFFCLFILPVILLFLFITLFVLCRFSFIFFSLLHLTFFPFIFYDVLFVFSFMTFFISLSIQDCLTLGIFSSLAVNQLYSD